MKNTIKNIEWLNAFVDLKKEILNNSSGQHNIIIDTTGKFENYYTSRKGCLGWFSVEEEYNNNSAKFTFNYTLSMIPGSAIAYDFDLEIIYDYKDQIIITKKEGYFENMNPSDLIIFYRTNFWTSRFIENTNETPRKNHFAEPCQYKNKVVNGELVPYEIPELEFDIA